MSTTSKKAVTMLKDLLKSSWLPNFHKQEYDECIVEISRMYENYLDCTNHLENLESEYESMTIATV